MKCLVEFGTARVFMSTILNKDDLEFPVKVLEMLRLEGYAIVEGVLDKPFIQATRAAMYRVQKEILRDVGGDRLLRAGEMGVLRLMLKYDPHFLAFLEIPELLAVVDAAVSETAIMHLQNGFILPSLGKTESPAIFQNTFHQDFPRVLNGYVASVNIMFAIDRFSKENGATLAVPGSHQRVSPQEQEYLRANSIPIECPAGSMFIFDSTLWHAAGANISGEDRLAINHQFTRSFIKQQIDYVRALGEERVLTQKPRTQQLLGWYTRVVTSLDEFYRPEAERLYRRGQG
jgi:ectoine hydroxylase-related dioxygenase (phytanoyl-CoA dioxygenase family)